MIYTGTIATSLVHNAGKPLFCQPPEDGLVFRNIRTRNPGLTCWEKNVDRVWHMPRSDIVNNSCSGMVTVMLRVFAIEFVIQSLTACRVDCFGVSIRRLRSSLCYTHLCDLLRSRAVLGRSLAGLVRDPSATTGCREECARRALVLESLTMVRMQRAWRCGSRFVRGKNCHGSCSGISAEISARL